MRNNKAAKIVFLLAFIFLVMGLSSCEKEITTEQAKIKPPVRTYIVTARIDKKGTNSNSEGTAVLKGKYNEETKILSYELEYKDLVPQLITFRNGAKGSVGVLISDIYRNNGKPVVLPILGSLTLNSLQERNLLKGQWFVAVNTLLLSPEISGFLTLKQI